MWFATYFCELSWYKKIGHDFTMGTVPGLILGLRQANERRRYKVKRRLSLAGRKPRISPAVLGYSTNVLTFDPQTS